MKYSTVEVIGEDFYKSFVSMMDTDAGKESLSKLKWFIENDGFDKDPYINAYRNGARDVVALLNKWGDPQYTKQLKERKELHGRTKRESDNSASSTSARGGEFSGGKSSAIMVR